MVRSSVFALTLLLGPAAMAQSIAPAIPFDAAPCLCPEVDGRAALLDELEALIRAAETYQAASPDFLRDLNRLLDRERLDLAILPPVDPVETPAPPPVIAAPPTVYVADDFADGDYTEQTLWAVRQGAWIVDAAHGLRMAPFAGSGAPALTIEDLVSAVLSGQPPTLPIPSQQPEAARQAALIEVSTPIGNAFDLDAIIQDHAGTGAAHFLIHQSGREWPGYRLEMIPGAEPRLRLARRGRDGYLDLAVANAPALVGGRPVAVHWRRDADGVMSVSLDGEPVLEARDVTFQGDWNGFIFFNARGDVSLRAIEITEARP